MGVCTPSSLNVFQSHFLALLPPASRVEALVRSRGILLRALFSVFHSANPAFTDPAFTDAAGTVRPDEQIVCDLFFLTLYLTDMNLRVKRKCL